MFQCVVLGVLAVETQQNWLAQRRPYIERPRKSRAEASRHTRLELLVILLVMQTTDAAMRLVPKRRLLGRGIKLQTEQDPEKPNPTFIPAADAVTRWMAGAGGIPSGLTEAIFNIPTTAHILGGAVIGDGPERGVVDSGNRVYGYENLMVCDGAAIPANPGVNPSLTITALAEHAMAQVPVKVDPSSNGRPRLPEAARPAEVSVGS